MKHVNFKPDLSGLSLGICDELENAISRTLEKVLELAFEDDETYIYFPAEYSKSISGLGTDGVGGPEVDDPLTVYLRVGLDFSEEEKPTYAFNLRMALADTIEACANDGLFSTGLGRISVALRLLADEIDDAIAKSTGSKQ